MSENRPSNPGLDDGGGGDNGDPGGGAVCGPIENGLVLKIEGEEVTRYFTYAWSSTTVRPQPISDWVTISDHAVEQFHIRCHQLTEGENDIQLLITELDSTATAALILINNKDDYQIDSCFLPENEKWEFPILVVRPGSGSTLMEILANHAKNVTAKVAVSSAQRLQTGSPVDKTWNMVSRIEEMLFPTNSEASIVSEKSELFQVVMSEFHVYETTKQSQETEKNVFNLLTRKVQDTFKKDFLFYIALAHRTCFLKQKQYRGRSPKEFVKLCSAKFEELDPLNVATALNGFFERENFNFHLDLKVTPDPQQLQPVVPVFWFLEKALDRLMREREIEEYRIYPTMLWITTYLSFCAQRQIQESDEKIWQLHFLQDAHQYSLDSDNIEGLKKALALGQMLHLPAKFLFHPSLIGELLAPTCGRLTRPFSEQKNAVIALEQDISSAEEFMEHVVIRLREAYKQSLQQSGLREFLQRVSNRTPLQAIKEGLLLLDAMFNVVNSSPLPLDEVFQEWILLLLNLTEEATASVLEQCLQEVLSQQYTVTRKYHSYIIEQTRARLKGLTVNCFNSVYKCDPIGWGTQILEEYLDEYAIPKFISTSDGHWKCFFELVVEKFPGAAKQRHVCKFLMRAADCYQERSGPSKLLVDLMKLDVPGLFSVLTDDDKPVATEFEDFLQKFIRKNSVLSQTGEIMECITSEGSLQEVILAAILKEMATCPKGVLLQSSFRQAVDKTVRELCSREEDMSWLLSEPSPKLMFCLDFVNACCTRISIFSDRFASIQAVDWTMFNKYFSLITKVGTLYSYSKSKQDETLCDALPDVVARHPSSSVRSYFEWIQKFHLMLACWKSRFEVKEANYEEINWYLKSHDNMHDLAGAISALSLVVSRVEVETLQNIFLEDFKKLNQLILRYIPSDPKAGW